MISAVSPSTDVPIVPCGPLPPEVCTIVEVYVDDSIGMTNHSDRSYLLQLSRAMLHGIHSMFPPPILTGHCGADPVSGKKLEKKEGEWDFTKEILGWIFDGENFTIQLPPEKCDDICTLIRKILHMQSKSKWLKTNSPGAKPK